MRQQKPVTLGGRRLESGDHVDIPFEQRRNPGVSSGVIPICCLSLGVSSSAISAGTRKAFALELRAASTILSNPFGVPSSTCSAAPPYPAPLSPTHRHRRAARSSLSVGRSRSSSLRLASFVPRRVAPFTSSRIDLLPTPCRRTRELDESRRNSAVFPSTIRGEASGRASANSGSNELA